ncbi:hypothetical protein AKJ16_DCAP14667 [Drosera capensis]
MVSPMSGSKSSNYASATSLGFGLQREEPDSIACVCFALFTESDTLITFMKTLSLRISVGEMRYAEFCTKS